MSTTPILADVYLDASLIVDVLITGAPHWGVSQTFITRLVNDNSRVYFSQIAYLEIGEAVRKLATKQQVPEELRRQYRLNRWGIDAQVQHDWMEFGLRQFALVRQKFAEIYEVPFREPLWRQSIDLMTRYSLKGHDAVHVATA
jgi:predicted nucleic acid-binding protein